MYTIYSKNNCIWCTRAKDLLEARGIMFKERRVEVEENKDSLLNLFEGLGLGKPKTVPQIFDERQSLIGGYTDLAKKFGVDF